MDVGTKLGQPVPPPATISDHDSSTACMYVHDSVLGPVANLPQLSRQLGCQTFDVLINLCRKVVFTRCAINVISLFIMLILKARTWVHDL